MITATTSFLALFDVLSMKKTKVESLVGAMLYTLAKNNLVDEAIKDIQELSSLKIGNTGKIEFIKLVSAQKEYVVLQHNLKALRLIILLLPYIENIDSYEEVTVDPKVVDDIIGGSNIANFYKELKQTIKHINKAELGYKVIQKSGDATKGKFTIVKHSTKAELLEKLTSLGLSTATILEKTL